MAEFGDSRRKRRQFGDYVKDDRILTSAALPALVK